MTAMECYLANESCGGAVTLVPLRKRGVVPLCENHKAAARVGTLTDGEKAKLDECLETGPIPAPKGRAKRAPGDSGEAQATTDAG